MFFGGFFVLFFYTVSFNSVFLSQFVDGQEEERIHKK